MKTIYKYQLEMVDNQEQQLPKGSQIISAIKQRDTIVVYAIVDTSIDETETIYFRICGTGHPFDNVNDYIFINTIDYISNLELPFASFDLFWDKNAPASLIFHVFYKK
jgi:hypothetical protein